MNSDWMVSTHDRLLGPVTKLLGRPWGNLDPDGWCIAEFVSHVAGKYVPPKSIILDAGAGQSPYRREFGHATYIALDSIPLRPGETGDTYLIADLEAIPFASSSTDTVLCTQVLEHVRKPLEVLKEFHGVIKPGGHLCPTVPLSWGQHVGPDDYYRYTSRGLLYLAQESNLNVIFLQPRGGIFWQLAEILAVLPAYLFPDTSVLLVRVFRFPVRVFVWLMVWWIAAYACYYLDFLDKDKNWTLGWSLVVQKTVWRSDMPEFNIVMYTSAQDLDTSCIANQHRLPFIHSLAKNMIGIGHIMVVTHNVPLSLSLSKNTRRLHLNLKKPSCRQDRDNLYVYNPLLPMNLSVAERVPGLLNLCKSYLKVQLHRICTTLGFYDGSPSVAWTTHPFHFHYAGLAREDLILYECYDDFSRIAGGPPDYHVLDLERRLAQRADLILATAHTLFERLVKENASTFYFPNAVDFEMFNRATDPDVPIAKELADIPRPIIGFMGNLCGWYDFQLLEKVISRQRPWSFVFIGEVADEVHHLVAPLQTLPNTSFLGWRDFDALPSFLKGFDVAIMPYQVSDWTHTINPNKMWQYMAAGVPIVSTPIREVLGLKGIIETGADPGGFIAAIERCLTGRNQSQLVRQIAIAKQESWDQRVKVAIDLVTRRLAGENGMPSALAR